MNMRHPDTRTARPADLFGHMDHLLAQLEKAPTARTARLKMVLAEMGRCLAVHGGSEQLPEKGPAKTLLRQIRRPCALYRKDSQIGPVALSSALR